MNCFFGFVLCIKFHGLSCGWFNLKVNNWISLWSEWILAHNTSLMLGSLTEGIEFILIRAHIRLLYDKSRWVWPELADWGSLYAWTEFKVWCQILVFKVTCVIKMNKWSLLLIVVLCGTKDSQFKLFLGLWFV